MVAGDATILYRIKPSARATVLARAVQMHGALARTSKAVVLAEEDAATETRLAIRELHYDGPNTLVEDDALQALVKRKRVGEVRGDVHAPRRVDVGIVVAADLVEGCREVTGSRFGVGHGGAPRRVEEVASQDAFEVEVAVHIQQESCVSRGQRPSRGESQGQRQRRGAGTRTGPALSAHSLTATSPRAVSRRSCRVAQARRKTLRSAPTRPPACSTTCRAPTSSGASNLQRAARAICAAVRPGAILTRLYVFPICPARRPAPARARAGEDDATTCVRVLLLAPDRMGLIFSMLRVGDADENMLRSLFLRRGVIKILVGVLSAVTTVSLMGMKSSGDDPNCPGSAALPLQICSTVLCLLSGLALLVCGIQMPAGGFALELATGASVLLVARLFVLCADQAALLLSCGAQFFVSSGTGVASGGLLIPYILQDVVALLYVYFAVRGRQRLGQLQQGEQFLWRSDEAELPHGHRLPAALTGAE